MSEKQGSQQSQIEYEVEKILNKRVQKSGDNPTQLYYLVHWRGYLQQEATWEPLQNLQNASAKIRDYQNMVYQKQKEQQYKLNNRKHSSNEYHDLKASKKTHQAIEKPLKRLKKLKDKKINKQSKKLHPILKEMYRYQKQHRLSTEGQIDNLIKEFADEFKIIGARKSQILFYLQFPNGQIKSISSKKLEQKNPFKIIQFYESHIAKQPKANNNTKEQAQNVNQ